MTSTGSLLVLCGPSGVGKSTLLKKLMDEFVAKFGFSVSHTTRKPRPGEMDGRDYYFVSQREMEHMRKTGAFLETAEFSGNLYGTSKKAVEDVVNGGQICILDIDVQGVMAVKESAGLSATATAKYVFVMPSSLEVLEKRLRDRGTETEEAIQKRLSAAEAEMEYGEKEGNFDIIIINDDLETAYKELKSFIFPTVENN